LAGGGASAQLVDTVGGECFAAAAVRAALFGQRDAFALPFSDQGSFDYLDNLPSSIGWHWGTIGCDGILFGGVAEVGE
jgi:hypothetical protein